MTTPWTGRRESDTSRGVLVAMALPTFSMVFSSPLFLSAAGSAVEVDVNPTLVAVQLGLLLLAFAVLKPTLFDPLMALYDERERRSKGTRREAVAMDEDAAALLRSYQSELETVRQAAVGQREHVRAEALAREATLLADTRAEIAVTLDRGRQALAAEVYVAEGELQQSVDGLARQMAARVLGREVTS